jgi:hypothetical protein
MKNTDEVLLRNSPNDKLHKPHRGNLEVFRRVNFRSWANLAALLMTFLAILRTFAAALLRSC